jgi:Agrobacterium tumefaciens protein Atu4866
MHHTSRARRAFTKFIGLCPVALAAVGATVFTARAAKGAELNTTPNVSHPYVGMWVTQDGTIRHELLANGRYDEARGTNKSAYQGRYKMTGDHIDYVDDTGFTADGEFRDGILYHAGMVLYRETRR